MMFLNFNHQFSLTQMTKQLFFLPLLFSIFLISCQEDESSLSTPNLDALANEMAQDPLVTSYVENNLNFVISYHTWFNGLSKEAQVKQIEAGHPIFQEGDRSLSFMNKNEFQTFRSKQASIIQKVHTKFSSYKDLDIGDQEVVKADFFSKNLVDAKSKMSRIGHTGNCGNFDVYNNCSWDCHDNHSNATSCHEACWTAYTWCLSPAR